MAYIDNQIQSSPHVPPARAATKFISITSFHIRLKSDSIPSPPPLSVSPSPNWNGTAVTPRKQASRQAEHTYIHPSISHVGYAIILLCSTWKMDISYLWPSRVRNISPHHTRSFIPILPVCLSILSYPRKARSKGEEGTKAKRKAEK